MVVLAAISWGGIVHVELMAFVRSAAFVCNVNVNACGPFLAHTWSLAYEEQFYILFPFVFICAARFGGPRSIVALLVSVICIAFAAKATSHNLLAEFALTFTYMLTGCVFALYWDKVHPILDKLTLLGWVILVAATISFACLITLPLPLAYFFSVGVAPFCVCAMILGTPVRYKSVARVFTSLTACYLGKISFTIYLWQQLATSPKPAYAPAFTFLLLLMVLLIAMASYRYFELPLIRLGHRLSVRQPATTTSSFVA